jgi:hypothetical protein
MEPSPRCTPRLRDAESRSIPAEGDARTKAAYLKPATTPFHISGSTL